MIPSGPFDLNLKKSAWLFQVLFFGKIDENYLRSPSSLNNVLALLFLVKMTHIVIIIDVFKVVYIQFTWHGGTSSISTLPWTG